MGRQPLPFGQRLDRRGEALEPIAVDPLDLHPATEVRHGESGGTPDATSGRKHVVGAAAVVPCGDGREPADEHRPGVAYQIQDVPGVPSLD